MSKTQTRTKTKDIFQYDDSETITQYIRRVNEYKIKLNQDKYDLVLKFINDILQLGNDDQYKLKSLRDFRRVKELELLKNHTHNKKMVNKYQKKFKKKLAVQVRTFDLDDSDKEEDNDSGYIINVMRRVLAAIQFRLISRSYNSGRYYSIKG